MSDCHKMGGIIGKGEGEDRRWKRKGGEGKWRKEEGEKRKLFVFTENDAKVAGRFIMG